MSLKAWSQIMTIVLIMVMFALVDVYAEKGILFPEISALALGFWVMAKPPWTGSQFAIWASPTLAALTGVLLLRYTSFSLFFLIGIAFVLVALQLKLLRSAIFPSISAAILPILTHTTDWLYPLSVSILMAMIVFGRFFLGKFSQKENSADSLVKDDCHKISQAFLPEFFYWGKLLAGVLTVTALALRFQCLFMIAPPLIVAFVELSRAEQTLRQSPFKILFLLALAACSGSLWLYLVSTIFQGPLWAFSGLALLSVFVLYKVLQVSFPPAAAISLLPVLVPASNFWEYPLHILLGSSLFILIGKFYFMEVEPKPTLIVEN
ncbi:MAG: hypothetical protein AB7D06_00600 [Pedobacter sp.]